MVGDVGDLSRSQGVVEPDRRAKRVDDPLAGDHVLGAVAGQHESKAAALEPQRAQPERDVAQALAVLAPGQRVPLPAGLPPQRLEIAVQLGGAGELAAQRPAVDREIDPTLAR